MTTGVMRSCDVREVTNHPRGNEANADPPLYVAEGRPRQRMIAKSDLRPASPVVQSCSSGTTFCGRFAIFPTSAFEGRRPETLQAILRFSLHE